MINKGEKQMKVQITPEIMIKIWKLHLNDNDTHLIGETLGISLTAVRRCIQIMTAAKNGECIDYIGGTNHQKQKRFAKEFFGIEDKKPDLTIEEPKKAEEEPNRDPVDAQNVATFMLKVTVLLEEQNELLRKFCSAFGVAQE